MRRLARSLALLLMASSSISSAQGTRASIAIGATWVDFGRDWGGAMPAFSAQATMTKALGPSFVAEIDGLTVGPTGGYNAVPDCIPGAPCVEWSSPDMLWGGTVSLGRRIGTRWRGSLGAGALTTVGMKGPGNQSSAVGSLSLGWSSTRSGLTPVFKIQALGLTSRVAGLRYLILPTVGIRF